MSRTLLTRIVPVLLLAVFAGMGNATIDRSREKLDPFGKLPGRLDSGLFEKSDEQSSTFSVHEDRLKRFSIMYEAGLEKKEPAVQTMIEAREAIARVETRMGRFKEKFALVVLQKIGEMEDPCVSLGTFGKQPAVLVTFNGTTVEVIAHGMGLRRIEEVAPKAEPWFKGGGSRVFVRADGFDPTLYKVLVEHDGPVAYADASKTAKDKHAAQRDKLHGLATAWMLTYYCIELAPQRLTVEEVMKLKDGDRPDPDTVWKAVQPKGKKLMEKKGD